MNQKFALYIDESGSPKPNPKDQAPYFAMGGVLVKYEDESTIHQKVAGFKQRWQINERTPLHGNEIRSRKKNFAWLGLKSEEERNQFFQDLTDMVTQCPIIAHGCVISRSGYFERYSERYGSNTWEMMKSAFSILLERVSKFVSLQEGKVIVYFEKSGKKEDRLISSYFNELRSQGAPFNPKISSRYKPLAPEQLQRVLTGIESKAKSNPILQVADLCLYPITKSKEQPNNRAFQALVQHQKLIDTILESDDLEVMGIKYYCFDNPLKH